MHRRNFIRVTGGHVVAAAIGSAALTGCTAGMPPEAIDAWSGPGADVTADVDVRYWLLSYAILAPHSHNLQSWFVDLGTPNEIVLNCDLSQPVTLAAHRRIELTTPRIVMETYKVLRVGATEVAAHRDGLALLDPMVVLMSRVGLFDRSKAPGPDDYATTSQIKDFENRLNATPGFLWMVTSGNDRVTQINAGRAYARVQLAATGHGVSMQPLQQALQEYPEQARPYADIRSFLDAPEPAQTVQMWARVGYASPVGPAPRRRLKSFIRV